MSPPQRLHSTVMQCRHLLKKLLPRLQQLPATLMVTGTIIGMPHGRQITKIITDQNHNIDLTCPTMKSPGSIQDSIIGKIVHIPSSHTICQMSSWVKCCSVPLRTWMIDIMSLQVPVMRNLIRHMTRKREICWVIMTRRNGKETLATGQRQDV